SEVSNYPNPFDSRKNGTTKINFTLNQPAAVKIRIYDLLGYLVQEIGAEGIAGSNNNIVWDGTDAEGRKVTQGMYLAVIEAEGYNGDKGKVIRKIGVIH
ncbi:MAG: FlgD immunoglobulin-like domain containing protein, partial [Candidatus Margulisiibacteriota bacterium]